MALGLVLAAAFVVLLASNIWLLRELDHLKRQLNLYQDDVASLDDRVCRLMVAVEEQVPSALD